MLFTVKWLENIFSKYQGNIEESTTIKYVSIDSREVAADTLFIPIIGERFNGHQFVEQAIENGAAAILWDEKQTLPASVPTDFPVFYTKDTTLALQQLAKAYRHLVRPIVVGITGSNGKTTTKDLLAALGKTSYRTHYTLGNFNNQIGLPLTILSMARDTELLILEMGMDRFGEIDILSRIASPDYAIITNIGESHIEFLGSREGIAKAKLEIINGLKQDGTLIVDGDEPLLENIHTDKNIVVKKVGFTAGNQLQLRDADVTVDGTSFEVSNGTNYQIPLFGAHHARNAAFAICIAELLQIPIDKQKEALLSFEHSGMRFEVLNGQNGSIAVNDSYNASPTSMRGAIDVIKKMEGFTRKIVVLGDILELGDFSEGMHRQIAGVIHPPITHLYTYGEYASYITEEKIKNNNDVKTKHYDSKDELLADLKIELDNNTIVLFKASRGMQFETMVNDIIIDKKK